MMQQESCKQMGQFANQWLYYLIKNAAAKINSIRIARKQDAEAESVSGKDKKGKTDDGRIKKQD